MAISAANGCFVHMTKVKVALNQTAASKAAFGQSLQQLTVTRPSPFKSPPHLSQHLIVLHVVHLIGADLSFQGVLVKFAADIDQQRGGARVDRTAQHAVAHVPRNVDAVAQDNTNEQP